MVNSGSAPEVPKHLDFHSGTVLQLLDFLQLFPPDSKHLFLPLKLVGAACFLSTEE